MYPSQYDKITTRSVRAMLLLALESGSSAWINDLSMRTESDQASETYAWLGAPPALHEFIGNRQLDQLRETSFAISNKDHEANVWFWSKDMRRDKLGMIQTRVGQLADRVNDLPAKLLSALIMDGESETCYDGQFFFDTDHAEGKSGTQSNDITFDVTTTTAPTADEMGEAILKSIQQMYGLKDDQGEPINQNASAFDVMVPVPFMGAALKARSALLGTGGASATLPALRDTFDISIVVNPRLSWTTKFATFRRDGSVRPFVLQEEPGGRDVVAIGDGSEFEQLNKKQVFGVDWAGNVGFGYWQAAVLTTLN
jgi:phage major head subunit gpT-like protein